MRQNKLSLRSVRSLAAVAALSMAPVVVGASSASALAVNQTICYRSDGAAVINPLNEDGFAYCVTRTGTTGGSGGSGGPVLCTITSTSYSCTPLQPLQG
jgi:pectate lyase